MWKEGMTGIKLRIHLRVKQPETHSTSPLINSKLHIPNIEGGKGKKKDLLPQLTKNLRFGAIDSISQSNKMTASMKTRKLQKD